MGYFLTTKGMLGYTAYLKVNYRRPLGEKTRCVCRVFRERREGRKVFLRGVLEEEGTGVVFSEGEALYVVDKRMVKMEIGKEIEEFL